MALGKVRKKKRKLSPRTASHSAPSKTTFGELRTKLEKVLSQEGAAAVAAIALQYGKRYVEWSATQKLRTSLLTFLERAHRPPEWIDLPPNSRANVASLLSSLELAAGTRWIHARNGSEAVTIREPLRSGPTVVLAYVAAVVSLVAEKSAKSRPNRGRDRLESVTELLGLGPWANPHSLRISAVQAQKRLIANIEVFDREAIVSEYARIGRKTPASELVFLAAQNRNV